jgi:hypothetical protein
MYAAIVVSVRVTAQRSSAGFLFDWPNVFNSRPFCCCWASGAKVRDRTVLDVQ